MDDEEILCDMQKLHDLTHETDPDLYCHSRDCDCPMCNGESPDEKEV